MIDLALAILVVTLLVYHLLEARIWARERGELLNRVMARTYQEFVYKAPAQDDTPQLTTDALETLWYEAQQRETLTEAS